MEKISDQIKILKDELALLIDSKYDVDSIAEETKKEIQQEIEELRQRINDLKNDHEGR